MRNKIEKVLEEVVRPMLYMHGGSVQLIEVTEDCVVKVRLSGACAGCPGAQMTIAGMVESSLKAKIPEVKKVEAVH
ncbi:MAG: NifU family protein [Candidatus Euphemobacter frigidus]|nr:NifU family protein [Candidatus Euphemobacter frigidus]MDP8276678.1 NifU family protein [Candidatus Euphemobacter frigidus]